MSRVHISVLSQFLTTSSAASTASVRSKGLQPTLQSLQIPPLATISTQTTTKALKSYTTPSPNPLKPPTSPPLNPSFPTFHQSYDAETELTALSQQVRPLHNAHKTVETTLVQLDHVRYFYNGAQSRFEDGI